MEFVGEVVATNSTVMEDLTTLWDPGDFMHGLHFQWLAEDDLPEVVSAVPTLLGPQTQISVRGRDASTMAIAAAISYLADGIPQDDLAIPYASPAVDGEDTLFEVELGPFPIGTLLEYNIELVDDAENGSVTGPFFVVTGGTPVPSLGPLGIVILLMALCVFVGFVREPQIDAFAARRFGSTPR